jgi:hypothetical protein
MPRQRDRWPLARKTGEVIAAGCSEAAHRRKELFCLCLSRDPSVRKLCEGQTTVLRQKRACATCFVVWLLGHLSVAHVVPGSLVDNPASHERTRVPLQLKLLLKKSVCSAVGGGGGNGGAGELGAVPDDEDCCSSG